MKRVENNRLTDLVLQISPEFRNNPAIYRVVRETFK